ncbi:hypothetical protein [Synechococcus sp. PCC 7336]|uniref:hypothetical protein n=1 Tax=Synechococcus sp. PCC 7336 TaxID=195250 RepID=UPI00034BC23B|nr:hypothetical protein [Synechococcus sp. PCC 7336]
MPATSTPISTARVFQISPLIRFTLLALYLALTIPLPILAEVTGAPVPPLGLAVGIAIGLVVLVGVLSERVESSDREVGVTYPVWIRWLRKGWSLPWSDIRDLSFRTTGQGGLIYYFVSKSGRAYLLPMRIVGFQQFLASVRENTEIDTSTVRALAQPWMYIALLGCTLLLLLTDAWAIATGLQQLGISLAVL